MAGQAVAARVDCYADCYRCGDANCTYCVYDEAACAAHSCPDGQTWDQTLQQCVGGSASLKTCERGFYGNGLDCQACPEDSNINSMNSSSCGATSFAAFNITDCYYQAKAWLSDTDCEYTDDKGTFVYSSDCYYSSGDLGQIELP